uniref:Glypican n=1 Tax=Clastoptera arizonana TaxID=38151 RepID=A0A1B6DDS1_9HEMI
MEFLQNTYRTLQTSVIPNISCMLVFYIIISNTVLVLSANTGFECSSVKRVFQDKGIHFSDVPKSPLSGDPLRICSAEASCCTEQAEVMLKTNARQRHDHMVKASLITLSSVLKTRSQKFDDFFKELLVKSKKDFHEMFKRTYGIIYEQNSYVFTDMFEMLENYYAKGKLDLLESMDNFFNILFQKMFTVIYNQYKFDDRYLGCVSEHMKELKPFDDVPNKLPLQLKRSFVATRTFAQALSIAGEIVANMIDLSSTEECARALLKMTHCSTCQGHQLKPCYNYCLNVMKGCLAYHSELDTEWNNFVDAIDKVIERLLGPFNIEMVVEPLNIKISDAIMNFQENAPQVSQRVFTGCGKPVLGRRRRETDYSGGTELSLETLQFSKSGKSHLEDESELGLDKLMKDIRLKVKDTRQFWTRFPYQMCNSDSIADAPGKNDTCWNGTTKSRYDRHVTSDGLSNQQNNPEVVVETTRSISLLNEQIFALKTITNKLKNAYNGYDVDWIDVEEYGSGSGSGDGIGDTEPDSEDDSGSGMYPTEHVVPEVVPEVSQPLPPRNDEDNNLHPIPQDKTNFQQNGTSSGSSTIHTTPKMSLNKALFSYLFPVVVVWFGSSLNEWLQ